jgi:hypothetical protein
MRAPCRLSVQKLEEIFLHTDELMPSMGVPLYGPTSTDASRRLAAVDQTKIRPRIAWALRVHPCVISRSCAPLFQASTRKNITRVYEKRVLAQLRRVQRCARGRSQTVAVRRKVPVVPHAEFRTTFTVAASRSSLPSEQDDCNGLEFDAMREAMIHYVRFRSRIFTRACGHPHSRRWARRQGWRSRRPCRRSTCRRCRSGASRRSASPTRGSACRICAQP